ncbi:hypothetical protein D3C84_650520 [compost metagenome]
MQVAELSQVGLKYFNGDVVFATQLCGERFQARVVAGDQHQIMPALGETLGVNRADASGSASDENGRASAHGVISLSECVKTESVITDCSACGGARFSQRRVVDVACCTAAIERGGIEGGQRRAAFEALYQIRIANERATECDQIGLVLGEP